MVSTRSGGKTTSTVRKRGKGGKKKDAIPPVVIDTRDDVKRSIENEVPLPPIVWTWKLRCRYWSGFLLGAIACAGTIYTYDQHDDWKALKFLLWLSLSLVGLYLNETRPGKRYFYDKTGRVMHM